MSSRDQAEVLRRVNIGLIVVCSILLLVSVARQLWLPAAIFLFFITSNAIQLRSRPKGST
ncbi:MAG: hypothetical protein AB8G26_05955 [Ilumatobacter sp.]